MSDELMNESFEIMDAKIHGMNIGIVHWLTGKWDIDNVIPPARFTGQEKLWFEGYLWAKGFEIIDSI